MAVRSDVLFWICEELSPHGEGTSTVRLRALKGKQGTDVDGAMYDFVAVDGSFELGEIYDATLLHIPGDLKPRCPRCIEVNAEMKEQVGRELPIEAATNIVIDSRGFLVRACQEHGEEYRIETHEVGQHMGGMFDELCDGCWDDVRAGERELPKRFGGWMQAAVPKP